MLAKAESAAVQQAIIVGQVTNALTGEAIRVPLGIEVAVRFPDTTQFRAFASPVSALAGGYFVIAGDPVSLLPHGLDPADALEFRFSVSAPGFSPLEQTASVSAADAMPSPLELELVGHRVTIDLISAPLLQQNLALTPLPVGLVGVVIDDHDPNVPVAGVSIQVIAPEIGSAVVTGADGRYRIDSLPIASSVTVQVDADGDLTTFEHLVDYATRFNQRIISLNG